MIKDNEEETLFTYQNKNEMKSLVKETLARL